MCDRVERAVSTSCFAMARLWLVGRAGVEVGGYVL